MICPHCQKRVPVRSAYAVMVVRIGNMRRRGVCTVECARVAKAGLTTLIDQGCRSPTRLKADHAGLVASWWRGNALVTAVMVSGRGHGHVERGGSWLQSKDWVGETRQRLALAGLCAVKIDDLGVAHQPSGRGAIGAQAPTQAAEEGGMGPLQGYSNEGGAPAGLSRDPSLESRSKGKR